MAYFLKGPTGFDWKFFKLIYPVVGKDNSFKTVASLTYSNATVKEGAIELTVTFIYFVGVSVLCRTSCLEAKTRVGLLFYPERTNWQRTQPRCSCIVNERRSVVH